MYKIICPFSLISSHEIIDIGFKGGNEIKLTLPSKLESPFGIEDVVVEFEPVKVNKFKITVSSQTLDTRQKQIDFLEKISEYLSFLVNKQERNPHYGTIFAQIDFYEFKSLQIPNNNGNFVSHVQVSDKFAISSIRPVNLGELELLNYSYHDVLRFYFDGLRAEHKKSKYFHWFLILERLENSERYKSLFNNDKLFNEKEKQAIIDLANQMCDGTKKGALINLLSRTREFRNAKLLKMINLLGIYNYKSFDSEKQLTEDVIRTIITKRNGLFHSGTDFPEWTLWNDLFPLVTLVVEKVSSNPEVLEN